MGAKRRENSRAGTARKRQECVSPPGRALADTPQCVDRGQVVRRSQRVVSVWLPLSPMPRALRSCCGSPAFSPSNPQCMQTLTYSHKPCPRCCCPTHHHAKRTVSMVGTAGDSQGVAPCCFSPCPGGAVLSARLWPLLGCCQRLASAAGVVPMPLLWRHGIVSTHWCIAFH